MEQKTKSNIKINAVDLFCGAGGLTHGLEKAGIRVKLGIDIDPACQYPYLSNNQAKFALKSVESIKTSELQTAFGKSGIRLLAGCAPCQTFSAYNQKATSSDKRWWLLLQFSKLVREIRPELVTMENVPRLVNRQVFDDFVKELESVGYTVNYAKVNCADYGIPQHRKRLVLLASTLGKISLLTPDNLEIRAKSVKDAIGKLPPIKAGETHKDDPLHQSAELSKINLKRIRASRPGGTWRDWDKKLIANCHKKSSGKTYASVYGRMSWDKPSPTITTQFFGFGNGRFGHPEQDRAISLREGAILQTFPSDYLFVEKKEDIIRKVLGRLIGNAVPVKLGEIIGQSLLKHVEIHNKLKSVGIRNG